MGYSDWSHAVNGEILWNHAVTGMLCCDLILRLWSHVTVMSWCDSDVILWLWSHDVTVMSWCDRDVILWLWSHDVTVMSWCDCDVPMWLWCPALTVMSCCDCDVMLIPQLERVRCCYPLELSSPFPVRLPPGKLSFKSNVAHLNLIIGCCLQSKTGELEGPEVDGFVKDMMELVKVQQ